MSDEFTFDSGLKEGVSTILADQAGAVIRER